MIRIIPKIEIKGANIVKGVNLEGLRPLGDPNYFILEYYRDGADEIFIQDVVASLYEKYSLLDIIKKISKECFIPITVGGGIKNIEDINLLLNNGADRVSINSHAFKEQKFISQISKKFGSSTLTFDAQIIKTDGKYMTYYNNGRSPSGFELIEWLKIIQGEGIGEIILTSVSDEGLMKGFDTKLLDYSRKHISVPLLVNGGIRSPEEIGNLKKDYDINGVILGSIVHYNFFFNKSTDLSKINKKITTNLGNFQTFKISQIKKQLTLKGIETRI